MSDLVSYQLSNGVAAITMDDGKANVMSVRMQDALQAALDRAEADKAAVLLCGRERLFSGGFDLAVFKGDRAQVLAMLEGGARLAERVAAFPRPVIAACTGHAVAMGVFLLLAADLRIGPESGARVHVNEVQIGLPIPFFAVELMRARLASAAMHVAAGTAEPLSGAAAANAGFFTEVVASDAVLASARARAEAAAKLHAGAFAESKRRLVLPLTTALKTAIRDDVAEWAKMFGRAA